MRWVWMRLACLLAALVLAAPTAAAAEPSHRIIAVGDLHGDFTAWRDIARSAQLVDDEGRWIGGGATLIQTGDVADRGPDSLKILQDLMRLQREAERANGQVIALVGNHEAMNVAGDLRYVSAEEYAAFADRRSARRRENAYAANRAAIEAAYRQRDPEISDDMIKQAWFDAVPLGLIEHQAAWRPEGEIGRWIIRNPAVVLIDGSLFVHGGISPSYANLSIEEINLQVRTALVAGPTVPHGILTDPLGPLWYRGLAEEATNANAVTPEMPASGISAEQPVDQVNRTSDETLMGSAPAPAVEATIEMQLDNLLSAYGAERIIIGHTPVLSGIAVRYDGRLILIDTGISAVYGGTNSYLEILDGIPIPHVVENNDSRQ